VPGPLRGLAAWASQLIPESTSGRHGWRRAREFLSAGTLAPDQMYASWVEYFDPEERRALLALATDPSRPVADIYRRAPSASALDAMQQTDLLSFLPGNLMSYGDAMSMAVALEKPAIPSWIIVWSRRWGACRPPPAWKAARKPS